MKDHRDNKHEYAKAKKFGGGSEQKKHNSVQCECGREISEREAEQNDGLCRGCFQDLMK